MTVRTAALLAGIANVLGMLLTLRGGFFAVELLAVAASGTWALYFVTAWRGGDLRWPAVAVMLTNSAFSVWFFLWGGFSPSGIVGWLYRVHDWAQAAALAVFLAATALRARPETLRRIAAVVFVLALIDAIPQAYGLLRVFEGMRNGSFSWAFRVSAPRAVIEQVVVPAWRLFYWATQVLYFRASSQEPESRSRAILGIS